MFDNKTATAEPTNKSYFDALEQTLIFECAKHDQKGFKNAIKKRELVLWLRSAVDDFAKRNPELHTKAVLVTKSRLSEMNESDMEAEAIYGSLS